MADYSQLVSLEKKQKKPVPSSVTQHTPQEKVSSTAKQSTTQLTTQSISQSTNQSMKATSNKVMEKPRGFYITEQLNQRIDEAVRYYQEKHNVKRVDRSIVVTVLLENAANWSEENLDGLLDKVISQLTRRLTNR